MERVRQAAEQRGRDAARRCGREWMTANGTRHEVPVHGVPVPSMRWPGVQGSEKENQRRHRTIKSGANMAETKDVTVGTRHLRALVQPLKRPDQIRFNVQLAFHDVRDAAQRQGSDRQSDGDDAPATVGSGCQCTVQQHLTKCYKNASREGLCSSTCQSVTKIH